MAIFTDLVENIMEVFMDKFSAFGRSFENCLDKLGSGSQKVQRKELSGELGKVPLHGTIGDSVGTSCVIQGFGS